MKINSIESCLFSHRINLGSRAFVTIVILFLWSEYWTLIFGLVFLANVQISEEKKFSKLKLMKNSHWTTIFWNRLDSLSIKASGNDVLRKVNFEDFICEFISEKFRLVHSYI